MRYINLLLTLTAEQEKVLKNAVETKKKSEARVADLEDKLKNSKAVRERELKQAQTDVDQAKKRYNQSITKTKDKEQVDCLLCCIHVSKSVCDVASVLSYYHLHFPLNKFLLVFCPPLMPSVLSHCWLDVRKSNGPVKNYE